MRYLTEIRQCHVMSYRQSLSQVLTVAGPACYQLISNSNFDVGNRQFIVPTTTTTIHQTAEADVRTWCQLESETDWLLARASQDLQILQNR